VGAIRAAQLDPKVRLGRLFFGLPPLVFQAYFIASLSPRLHISVVKRSMGISGIDGPRCSYRYHLSSNLTNGKLPDEGIILNHSKYSKTMGGITRSFTEGIELLFKQMVVTTGPRRTERVDSA
jgi:hypothetical protein